MKKKNENIFILMELEIENKRRCKEYKNQHPHFIARYNDRSSGSLLPEPRTNLVSPGKSIHSSYNRRHFNEVVRFLYCLTYSIKCVGCLQLMRPSAKAISSAHTTFKHTIFYFLFYSSYISWCGDHFMRCSTHIITSKIP